VSSLERAEYARRYGPTTGDRIRLADTDLWVEVQDDDAEAGEELLGGNGKTARDGVLVAARAGRDSALDLIITNVVVLDPMLGIRKTCIGVVEGRIAGIGRAGNPYAQQGIELVVDSHTAIINGEGMLATAGLIDSHVHLSSPQIAPAALGSGITTIVGMGIGGVWDVGANPAANLHSLMEGWRGTPLNAAFLARGSSASPALLEQAAMAGSGGYKVHEDWGAAPEQIDSCLGVAEQADLPVALHTDTLNEAGYLSDTLDALRGRTVHAYHVEGGGGHPDLLRIVQAPNVIPSSTTPTLPLTPATVAELLPMTMTVHRLQVSVPSDLGIAQSRIREFAIAAENALHDEGAISIVNSDSMGMGRAAEVARRTFQLAHVRALLAGQAGPDHDNAGRVLRYLAKLTINPARAHGIAHEVGSLEAGKLADIVLWQPARFGAAPELVIKAGFVAWGASGSGSGSTRLTQPIAMGPFFGGLGGAPSRLSRIFVSGACLDDAASRARLPGGLRYVAVRDSRTVDKSSMVRNAARPRVDVPVDAAPVHVDGVAIDRQHVTELPLTRAHNLG
jgi:urease subunit alpha